ncbi:putative gustatory receptor 28a isoform X1 [Tribolium castaneum]|uniref:putative gustatory receptor 28a isoform X1 n=1 Tax=Tribolium castaneum TaxID=7070 RepID=UPI0030FF3794
MTKDGVYNTLFFIVYVSLLLGPHPTYFGKTGRKTVLKTNKYCNFIILFYLSVFVILVYYASLDETPNPVTNGKLYNFNTFAKLLILVVSLSGTFGFFGTHILSYINKASFKKIVNTVATFDETWAKLGLEINHKEDFRVCLVFTLTGPFFTFCNVLMEMWNIPRENIDPIPLVVVLTHLIPFMLIHQGETQFVVANIILRRRFALINSILRKLYKNKYRKLIVDGKKSEEQIVDICIRSHDKLCDVCDSVNRIFGFIIIIGCLIQFNTIVFAFCYCYYSISIRPISTLGWFFWSLLRIYELARKAAFAHLNSNEARATLNWVSKLIIRSNPSLEEKLQIFALQLTHRAPTFTALGLFPINGSFAFTVIFHLTWKNSENLFQVVGAATTYITIIYQFQVNKPTCGP